MDWIGLNSIWQDIVDFCLNVLAPLGGVSAVVLGLSAWIGNIWAQRIIQRQKSSDAQTIEMLKSQLELSRSILVKYRESQFEAYNSLWSSLFKLKFAADELWQSATPRNLNAFVEQLKLTQLDIGNNALLVEEDHYRELHIILRELADYRVGKTRLIDQRRSSARSELIRRIIEENRERVEQYTILIEKMREVMRDQLSLSDDH